MGDSKGKTQPGRILAGRGPDSTGNSRPGRTLPRREEASNMSPILTTLRRGWRFFRSLKFGIFLLLLIAVCLVRASLIAADPTLGPEAIPEAKNRVYGTAWFLGLLALFGVQFVVSTWHVTVMSVGIAGKRVFRRLGSFYDRQGYRAVVERGEADPAAIERRVARHCTLFHSEGGAIYGHRGLLSRIGPTGVHAGILTVLAAGMLWAWLGRTHQILSEGRWVCAEGDVGRTLLTPEDPSHALGPGNQKGLALRARVRLLDFDMTTHPHSDEPADFSSILEIQEPDRPGRRVVRVDMNTPVEIDRLIYHQAAYIPLQSIRRGVFDIRQAKDDKRIVTVDTGEYCPTPAEGTDLILEVSAPEAGARWAIARHADPGRPIAWGIVEQGVSGGSGDLGNPDGMNGSKAGAAWTPMSASPPPGSLLSRVDPREFGSGGADGSEKAGNGGGSSFVVRYLEPAQAYATVLSVISVNPALPMIYVGVATVFVFALVTFGFRYRQVFGMWDEGKTRLTLAMVPHRSHYALQPEFARLLNDIGAAGGQVVEHRMPEAGSATEAETDEEADRKSAGDLPEGEAGKQSATGTPRTARLEPRESSG